MAETDLYLPIKRFLEAQGYAVKAEVKSCDVMGMRGKEPPVIVELKQAFSLQLIYQAMDRLMMTDHVYVAITAPKRGLPREALKLAKRLGIGVIIVSSAGSIDVVADPLPYVPRKNKKRTALLLREYAARQGDPNLGGSRGKIVTAYRQDAMKCADHLRAHGPQRIKDIKAVTGVARAANILRDNHYGWFQKVDRGVYRVAPG
jgi:hypothetical protein